MEKVASDWPLAFAGGVILALMIRYNSLLATYSTPFVSSWVAHGVGSVVSLLLLLTILFFFKKNNVVSDVEPRVNKSPFWAYLGGIPGTFTVILAAFSVNSGLGLSGTVVLMLFGQVAFSLFVDAFGYFGVPKRRLALLDVWVILLILTGSGLVIISR